MEVVAVNVLLLNSAAATFLQGCGQLAPVQAGGLVSAGHAVSNKVRANKLAKKKERNMMKSLTSYRES